MKLHDLGATVLILSLLFGSHFLLKAKNPQYNEFIGDIKQHVSDFNEKYIDPFRTPEDDIDNPVWNSDIG